MTTDQNVSKVIPEQRCMCGGIIRTRLIEDDPDDDGDLCIVPLKSCDKCGHNYRPVPGEGK